MCVVVLWPCCCGVRRTRWQWQVIQSRSPGSNPGQVRLDFPESRPVHRRELFRVPPAFHLGRQKTTTTTTITDKKGLWTLSQRLEGKEKTGDKGRGKGTQSTPRPLAILPTISLASVSFFLRSSFFFTGAYDQFINATWRHPPTTSCLLQLPWPAPCPTIHETDAPSSPAASTAARAAPAPPPAAGGP